MKAQPGTTHVIGAGLAGLAAATRLAEQGRHVIVYEASGQAGGRCRSYHDAAFGGVIDNGNHLLLSGNGAALNYLKRIGSGHAFIPAKNPVFDFVDAQTHARWTLRLNNGKLPFWLLDKTRRVPGSAFMDYLSILRLLKATPAQTIDQLIDSKTTLYQRLWHPFLLSALNTHPQEASAQLAASILRGTLLKGGSACRPLVAEGLSDTFIEPALHYLAVHQADIVFNHRLRSIGFEQGQATALDFANGESVMLSKADSVICAVPSWSASDVLPDIQTPDQYRSILNAHFRIAPPTNLPAIMGVINATVEWIFAFPDRISITISDADRLMQMDRETLAHQLWQEVAAITGLANTLPPWQIVKEKRATFAATPDQDARRPDTVTRWGNIYLAGDWTQTGLPATIEGAVRSGEKAASMVMRRS